MENLLRKNKLTIVLIAIIFLFFAAIFGKGIIMHDKHIAITSEPLIISGAQNNNDLLFVLPKGTPIYKDRYGYFIFIKYTGNNIVKKIKNENKLIISVPSRRNKNIHMDFNKVNYSKVELELLLKRSSLTKEEIIEVINSL